MTSSLSFIEQDFPQKDLESNSIVDLFMRNASWVWTPEPGLQPPLAPPNEQRVFRKTFSTSTSALNSGKTPTSATIIVAVDNDFALYINGVLFRPSGAEEIQNSWEIPRAFSVPIPQGTDKLVFAIRAINFAPDNNAAGLKAAIRITHSDSSTDYLVTGQDRSWLGRRLYPEGWEKPEFDDRAWEPATVFPATFSNLNWGNLRRPSRLSVASVLPSATSGSLPNQVTTTVLPSVQSVKGVVISEGGLAGMVIGIVLASAGLAVVLTWWVMRRRSRGKVIIEAM